MIGSVVMLKPDIKNNKGDPYSGGDVFACMFGVVFGVFSMGPVAPNIKCVVEGRIAGKLAYQVIDRVPQIPVNDKSKKQVKDLHGHIEFKNVNFSYPTRPDQKILKNFSCTIESGKTTALVGPSGSGKSTVVQMIERFYDPAGGSVIIDGEDIRELNLKSLRS